ncbi:MAG: poly-gamma-glutamate system protein [Rubripirellula sp.]
MKRLFWRPRQVSQTVIWLMAGFSLLGLATIEHFRTKAPQSDLDIKMAASTYASEMMRAIKAEKMNMAQAPDSSVDPAGSGMIGQLMSPVTTLTGRLSAKQTAVNPNFAAVVVEQLIGAGVESGDLVAVGYSGSFPGMNVNVCAALKAVGAQPVIIASAGSSQWGANNPDMMWVDMESLLFEETLLPFKAVACSIGGYEDIGLGMTAEAKDLVKKAIKRNNLPLLTSTDFVDAIDERMQIYHKQAGGRDYKAYINVGGGTISVGRSMGKRAYKPGLNLSAKHEVLRIDSVMTRFMSKGTPVIHVVEIDRMAGKYGLPLAPQQMPPIGEGGVYQQTRYNKLLTATVLVLILLSLRALVLTDFGYRFVKGRGGKKTASSPEPMV